MCSNYKDLLLIYCERKVIHIFIMNLESIVKKKFLMKSVWIFVNQIENLFWDLKYFYVSMVISNYFHFLFFLYYLDFMKKCSKFRYSLFIFSNECHINQYFLLVYISNKYLHNILQVYSLLAINFIKPLKKSICP
jgi:hypothetical protein